MANDTTNEELAEQFKAMLEGSDRPTAFGDEPAAQDDSGASELDFLNAMRAFRAARNSGDPDKIAEAEERLRSVVRGELTESC